VRGRESAIAKVGVQQDGRAIVGVVGCDHVIAGRKRVHQRQRGRASRRKCESRSALFQRGQRVFQGFAVRVVGTAVEVSAGQAAVVGFLERGRLMNGVEKKSRAPVR